MQEPQILLADEPTASPDPVTSRQIMELLQKLADEIKLPVLIHLHNVAEAKEFTRRIVGLSFGRVIFDGPPAGTDADAMHRVYSDTPAEVRQGEGRGTSGSVRV